MPESILSPPEFHAHPEGAECLEDECLDKSLGTECQVLKAAWSIFVVVDLPFVPVTSATRIPALRRAAMRGSIAHAMRPPIIPPDPRLVIREAHVAARAAISAKLPRIPSCAMACAFLYDVKLVPHTCAETAFHIRASYFCPSLCFMLVPEVRSHVGIASHAQLPNSLFISISEKSKSASSASKEKSISSSYESG